MLKLNEVSLYARSICRKFIFCVMSALCCGYAAYTQPVVKVDFNMNGRKAAEVNAFGYTPWEVKGTSQDTLQIDKLRFSLSTGNHCTLQPTWFKAAVRGAAKARFTGDAVMVDGTEQTGDAQNGPQKRGTSPAEITLTIEGLNPGKHTLITYHNIIDALDPALACPVDIYVDGKKEVTGLVPSVRALEIHNCASATLKLNAQGSKPVVIRFVAAPKTNSPYRKIFINGFQLDGINPADQAYGPLPADRDEHVALQPGGSYTLQWNGADKAQFHDLYFGPDSAAVARADKQSATYKGRLQGREDSFKVSGLNTLDKYYWRVDEGIEGQVFKGKVWELRGRHLAFDGAEGYGRFARGGRGGQVVYVTNLNDAGPGSLREAITKNIGPRVILFKVGGLIQLKSRLVLSQPNVTVAGQTAPGKGICIRSAPFGITGNDCIARFIRVRVGDGPTYDGMGLTGANNSIIDHCSISWTKDEAFSSRGAHNITLQRTLISEALNAAGHKNYPKGKEHGFAATIGGDIGSFHHNLLADNYGRNWSLGGGLVDGYYGGRMDITNNIVYNWGHRATDGGAHEVNFVNNYYKPGPGTDWFYAFNAQHEGVGRGTQRCYFAGNVMPGHFDASNQAAGRKVSHSHGDTSSYETYVDQPFFASYVSTQSAAEAYKIVLSDVGCNQPELDLHDQRIIRETLQGKTTVVGSVTHKKGFPDKVADAGGYELYPTLRRPDNWDSDLDGLPDWWEKSHGLNPNGKIADFTDSHGDSDKDGYTHLDDYLDWMASPHYFAALNQSVQIDLKSLSRGFADGPVFTVDQVAGGKVTLDKNGLLRFIPQKLTKGRGNDKVNLGSFSFTVTDSQGDRMTRKVNLAFGVKS